jgi:protein tyrosine phosphatase (PTP) superfamily phosphohydrolase (DUF442 family)
VRLLPAALALAVGCSSPHEIRPVSAAHLENVHEISPGVFTGAGPHGEASFRDLAAMGVRTVISVDGAKPDVDAARKNGLKYVHIPIGYDGIPADRTKELAKALREQPGPFYLHCHHGKHRGPAAAAVACVAAGKMDNERAVQVLKTMGTGEQYLGLWASAREARTLDPAELRALKVEFREVAPVPPVAEAMVALDEAFENLGHAKKAGWGKPPSHPDVDPPHEALRAREILTEMMRTDEFKGRPADYRAWMQASLDASADLERGLRAGGPGSGLDGLYERFRKTCADCHKPYRNAPKR